MAGRTIVTEEKKPQVFALASGILIGYAITCIVFIAYAVLITYTSLTEDSVSVVVSVTTILSVLVAGFDAAKGAEKNGWIWGLTAGLVYAVILLLLGSVINRSFAFSGRTITILVLSFAGGGLGGVLGINVKK